MSQCFLGVPKLPKLKKKIPENSKPGHCKNKGKKPLNFFSGIVFVSAGLLNLCGIIVYVAHVTEEVGHKARQPRDDPALRYRYGWCVAFSAFSFSLMEFAGAMFVYVYIKR